MENIQVALRVRPLNRKEFQRNYENIWEIPTMNTITLSSSNSREYFALKKINCTGRTTFHFDQCFSSEQNNIQVYQQTVKRIVMSSLNGINGTIFMYGQTGSGKTFTMMGLNKNEEEENNVSTYERDVSPNYRSCTPPKRQPSKKSYASGSEQYQSLNQSGNGNYIITDVTSNTGILVMALRDIFDTIENDMDKTYFLRCSYVEIYNDQVFDLLKPADRLTETLSVSEDANKDFYIKGITEESMSSIEEVMEKLKKGEANRHYARTTMNHSSSRSHTIFRLTVQSVTNNFIREYRREKSRSSTNINNSELRSQFDETFEKVSKMEGTIVTESLLNFVDLAGSEKVSHHQMLLEDTDLEQGGIYGRDSMMAVNKMKERVKEGQHINKSLFFLTQVISLKSEGKSNQYIPYRNSPLTKILRSSLGGNSRTLIILCITPACAQFEQTMSTLRFGMSAKKIENKVQANIMTRDDDAGLKLLISDYEKKLKDAENARLEEQAKCYNVFKQIEELQAQKRLLTEKVHSLCRSRLVKMAESIPVEDLSVFYKQAKERYFHFNKAGVVFSCKDLNKYDKILNSSVTFRDSGERTLTKRARDSQEVDSEDEEDVKKERSGAGESVCRLYMKFLKVYKEQNELLARKLETYQKNMQAVCERYYNNYVEYLQLAWKLEASKKYCQQYKQDTTRIVELEKNVRLYRDLNGVEELDEVELEKLEKHFWEKLDIIKMERAKRIIMREMGIEKENIVRPNDTFAVTSNEYRGEQYTKKETQIDLEAFIGEELGNDFDSNKQMEKLNQEKEYVIKMLKEGMGNIDQELEVNKSMLLENKELFNQSGDSDDVAKRVRTTKKTDREDTLSSYRQKSALKKATSAYGNSLQGTGLVKKAQNHSQTNVIPKLDLGFSLVSTNTEQDPKLSDNEVMASLISTKRINKGNTSPRAAEPDTVPLKSQRRGRSEAKETSGYSLDKKERKANENKKGDKGAVKYENKKRGSVCERLETYEEGLGARRDSNVKSLTQTQKTEETVEKENSHRNPTYNTSKDKGTESTEGQTMTSQYHSNPPSSSLSHLQNKLSKHLASLEKYFVKPMSSIRKSRSIRSDQNSVTHIEITTRTMNDVSLTPKKSKGALKEETETKGKKLEAEFEFKDDSEGEYKIKESGSKRFGTEEKEKKRAKTVQTPMKEEENDDSDKFGLNITNIEKEETMFTNSIFSIKDIDGITKEKDYEIYMENNVLKQLDNILEKGGQSVEMGDCLDMPLNESKKRRKRADRLKK